MKKHQHPERDNSRRIIEFRQHAFLLLTQYTQVEIAEKLDVDKTNFNKYYNDPDTKPGPEFLNKFDAVFGEEVIALIDYLKTYKKREHQVSEPLDEYVASGLVHNYIESLKDQIGTLKSDKEFYKGFYKDEIAFYQHLILKHLPENTPGKTEAQVSEDFSVRIFTPEQETGKSDENELKEGDR